jgi:hypothetical protein
VANRMDTSSQRPATAFSRMQERDGRPIAHWQTLAARETQERAWVRLHACFCCYSQQ